MITPIIPRASRPDIDAVFTHLKQLFTADPPDPSLDPIARMRYVISQCFNIGPKPSLDDITVLPVSADGVPAEWVLAKGAKPQHRIVFLHGGGWSAGTIDDYRPMAAELARRTGSSVLMIDYRLAPEHPFPAGLDDCCRALAWAVLNGPPPPGDGAAGSAPAASLSIIGDSAGSNLAAAACADAIRKGGPVPDRLILIGPALDAVHDPNRIGRNDFLVTPDTIAGSFGLYSGGAVPLTDPRLSPMHTEEQVLSSFPPTLIQVSGAEGWIFDARRFTRRLEDARVRVVLSIWPDLPHVWHVFQTVLPEAQQALQEVADFLRT
jgi:acetyl esterase/lipase